MTDPLPTDGRLSAMLDAALRDCAEFSPHSPYVWKPKSMIKLAALGLVQSEILAYFGKTPFSVTAKGRAYLRLHP